MNKATAARLATTAIEEAQRLLPATWEETLTEPVRTNLRELLKQKLEEAKAALAWPLPKK